jgi:lipid-A-disaccharide synthase
MKRVLIIAGETSGDLHGASLMRSMLQREPDLSFRGIGGSRMIEAGLDASRHVREMNFMGFFEVIRHLPMIRRTLRDLAALLDSWKPHLVILIDYPGFNLKFAPEVKARRIPLMYYISPQLWAWHESRVELIRKYVDRMVVLFEFEREFYRGHGIEADFVGHPLLDLVHPSGERAAFRRSLGAENTPLIGFLPGSRKQEIRRILPAMAESLPRITAAIGAARGVLGCAPDLDDSLYRPFLKNSGLIPLREKTYDIMAHSDALVVTSGTATLEAGISGTPMVIVYRTSPLTYAIGKRLVKIGNIGLINIVAGSRIVPELHQNAVTPDHIAAQVTKFLKDMQLHTTTSQNLARARTKLGASGASERAAAVAMNLLGW